jgi:hypothetical protein
MTYNNNCTITILKDIIDHRLRYDYSIKYFVVECKILDEENKISEITIHTHESIKQNAEIVINEIKTYMKQEFNLTIINNKNIKQDKILNDTYEIKILTMNRPLEG